MARYLVIVKAKNKTTSQGTPFIRLSRKKGKFSFEAQVYGDDSGRVSFLRGDEVLFSSDSGKVGDWLREARKLRKKARQVHKAHDELVRMLERAVTRAKEESR